MLAVQGTRALIDSKSCLNPNELEREAYFLLVPDCEDRHCLVGDVIPDDITAVAKVDKPFPKLFGKVIGHPAEAGGQPPAPPGVF